MSDTPRSDVNAIEMSGGCIDNDEEQSMCGISFARTLETELATLRQQVAEAIAAERAATIKLCAKECRRISEKMIDAPATPRLNTNSAKGAAIICAVAIETLGNTEGGAQK